MLNQVSDISQVLLFCVSQKWNFKHFTSIPDHSQGNGKTESAVKIAKNIMKKSIKNKGDVWLNILNWGDTQWSICTQVQVKD